MRDPSPVHFYSLKYEQKKSCGMPRASRSPRPSSFESALHTPLQRLPKRLQRRHENARLAKRLLTEIDSLHGLTVTSKVALENMQKVPTRAPTTASEREQDDKTYDYQTRRLKQYATWVFEKRQKQLSQFARDYGLGVS